MEYLLHILIVAGIYGILAISLDLLAGYTALLSLAHAAFFGIGAYTSAVLTTQLQVHFALAIATGMGLAAALSLLVSLPSLRLRDDYFVVATLAFQIVISSMLTNWQSLTGGPLGIPGIAPPELFGWELESRAETLVLVASFGGLAYAVASRIVASPYGRVLETIREDEILARSLGKHTLRFKLEIFAVSAALAASAGSLYAHYQTYIDPNSFTINESILVIAMVIIGGAGSVKGPLLGAVVLVALPELLRFVGVPGGVAANLRQLLYGTLLIVMMIVRPSGLLGRYGFERPRETK
ncbi:MAG: branched-chain amino acid ABC transporter permease [Myxococcota bacterium]